jgi:hypothetical protein
MMSADKEYVIRLLISLSILGGMSMRAAEPIAGTWACQSMNVGAYTGRRCPLEPRLQLGADNTYEWGRETGKWEYKGGALSLSGRAGKGRRNEDGKLLFEYDLNGKHYLLTLYRVER